MALQPGTQMMTQLEKHKREGVERRYEKKKKEKKNGDRHASTFLKVWEVF